MQSNNKKTNVGFAIHVNEKAPNIDFKYGIYNSKQEAFDYLGEEGLDVLAVGLTVGIMTENGVEEYWFKKACNTVEDLVPKFSSASGGGGFNVPEGTSPEETAAIDSNAEVQQFLDGYGNDKTLSAVINEATNVASESDIDALFA